MDVLRLSVMRLVSTLLESKLNFLRSSRTPKICGTGVFDYNPGDQFSCRCREITSFEYGHSQNLEVLTYWSQPVPFREPSEFTILCLQWQWPLLNRNWNSTDEESSGLPNFSPRCLRKLQRSWCKNRRLKLDARVSFSVWFLPYLLVLSVYISFRLHDFFS